MYRPQFNIPFSITKLGSSKLTEQESPEWQFSPTPLLRELIRQLTPAKCQLSNFNEQDKNTDHTEHGYKDSTNIKHMEFSATQNTLHTCYHHH